MWYRECLVLRATALRLSLGVGVFLCACYQPIGPVWVDRVALEPDSLHLPVGDSSRFVATPRSARGEALTGRSGRVKWFAAGDTTRSVLHEGDTFTVRADSLGSRLYLAVLGRGLGEAWVHSYPAGLSEIIPLLDGHPIGDRLVFTRNSVVAQRHTLSARLQNAHATPMNPGDFRISWVSDRPDDVQIVGGASPDPTLSINADNLTATITLTVSGRRRSLPVVVTPRSGG